MPVTQEPSDKREFTLDEIDQLLYTIRYEAGLSQADLGKKFGWVTGKNSCGNISKYESGSRFPNLITLSRWVRSCGFEIEIIVREKPTTDMVAFDMKPREWKVVL